MGFHDFLLKPPQFFFNAFNIIAILLASIEMNAANSNADSPKKKNNTAVSRVRKMVRQ